MKVHSSLVVSMNSANARRGLEVTFVDIFTVCFPPLNFPRAILLELENKLLTIKT